MSKELKVPPATNDADNATEIIRGWLIDGSLHCVLLPTIWKDNPETWGILLADIAGHISNALSDVTGADRDEILQRIRNIFVSELDSPTDFPEGDFCDD